MQLEQIAQMYGMIDYYEARTGRIYYLSEARVSENGMLTIPVSKDGELIGFTRMEQPRK